MPETPDSHEPDAAAPAPVPPDAAPLAKRRGSPPRKRTSRRVTTEPPPGSDPTPLPEPPRGTGTENDDRLKADKPPHWG